MVRASNLKVPSLRSVSSRSVCLALVLLSVQVLSAPAQSSHAAVAKVNRDHASENFSLDEAENLFRDSLEQTHKYALLVNRLKTEAKVDKI